MKIVRNTLSGTVVVADVGRVFAATETYTIPPQDYPLWAASVIVDALITSGVLVVNDGYDDLKPTNAIKHIHEESLPRSSSLLATTTVLTTANSTLTLTATSRLQYMFAGSAIGQIVQLGDARTYDIGHSYSIWNSSIQDITLKDGAGAIFATVKNNTAALRITLEDNSTLAGQWRVAVGITSTSNNNTDFIGSNDGFEDFMFDAYAGSGGNDNQYSFLPASNSGSSTLDGNISVVGNDYEGIHTLSSLAVATSRPLLDAFGGYNRIKLGANPESFEVRVRIETLADNAQKFTTRYGLMDVSTAGMPANGILFSYDPVYAVTPVRQLVTATPVVTSKNPTQHFIETINGTAYDYLHQVDQVITVTPNSFPVATYQVVTVTITAANNTLYTITINGTAYTYTSDANGTVAEINAGLKADINGDAGCAVAATGTTTVILTSKTLGLAFTYSVGARLAAVLTTANVAKAVYTETINGTSYTFTSDGTPTAAEVVTGLKALINADVALPVIATGTTTLILTGNVLGDTFTYSGSTNLTQYDTTPTPNATTVCNGLRALIAADPLCVVTESGTTTLILTGTSNGAAFTYAGSANLTNVLTTPHVDEVFYSGNWLATTVRSSAATTINTNVPVVANQWYRLKATINAEGNQAFFYVDNVYVGTIIIPITTEAMRYVFKLEKTVGVSPRTTSIDYICWRRTRS